MVSILKFKMRDRERKNVKQTNKMKQRKKKGESGGNKRERQTTRRANCLSDHRSKNRERSRAP